MKIDVRQMGSVTVIAPQGPIAQDDVKDFVRTTTEQREATGGRLVLDFAKVAFLDSAGVEAVWDLSDHLQESGRAAKLAGLPEICREILELTGLARDLDLFDTTESAVKSFA